MSDETNKWFQRAMSTATERDLARSALEAERTAHAATREELRRAREFQLELLDYLDNASQERPDPDDLEEEGVERRAVLTLVGVWREQVRARMHSTAPASPSTEAAVRAGIEAAAAYVHDQEMRGLARQVQECVDPAAIAARLEGRVSREMNRTS